MQTVFQLRNLHSAECVAPVFTTSYVLQRIALSAHNYPLRSISGSFAELLGIFHLFLNFRAESDLNVALFFMADLCGNGKDNFSEMNVIFISLLALTQQFNFS